MMATQMTNRNSSNHFGLPDFQYANPRRTIAGARVYRETERNTDRPDLEPLTQTFSIAVDVEGGTVAMILKIHHDDMPHANSWFWTLCACRSGSVVGTGFARSDEDAVMSGLRAAVSEAATMEADEDFL
jgi:hypothetical protein